MNEQQQLVAMLERADINHEVFVGSEADEFCDAVDHEFDTIICINPIPSVGMDANTDCYFFFSDGKLVATGAE